MRVASVLPTSLLDYPGSVAAVVFVASCNFRCPFCHNAELVLPEKVRQLRLLDPGEVLAFLAERRSFLDGLVVTGGEPTLQPDLREFVVQVKQLGLLVKLDTNGSRPDVLAELFEERLIDYVAMDIKAPLGRYSEFAGVPADLGTIERSIGLIRERAPDYEFRTTVAPTLGLEDITTIAREISGARRYVLQRFVVPPRKALVDPAWGERPALDELELKTAWEGICKRFPEGGVR